MKLLDRYITRQYLTNVAVLTGCLLLITVLIDFALNFDEFLQVATTSAGAERTHSSAARVGWLTVVLVWDFWWPQLVQLSNYLIGLTMIGGMGFTCAQLVKHREFVAVLAGGISLHRLALPIVVCGVVLSFASLACREWIVPDLAPLLTRDRRQIGRQGMTVTSQPLCSDSRGRVFYAKAVDLERGEITGLWVWERDPSGLMSRRVRAESARWDGEAWVLTGGWADDARASDNRTTVPVSTAVERIETDLDPTALRLRKFEGYAGNLSMGQLGRLIERFRAEPGAPPERVDRLDRLRWGRVSLAASNMLSLLICLPFFLRREPCNMVVQSLYAAPVAIGALGLSLTGATAPMPGLPPAAAVFVPVLVLIPLAIAAVGSVKT